MATMKKPEKSDRSMSDNNDAGGPGGGALDPAIAGLVRALAALLDEVNLSEIEYAEGPRSIRVARGTTATSVTVAPAAAPAPVHVPAAEPAGTVKAPMVGTVYLSPQPDAAPFIKIGDGVRDGQTLLIVEAMKVMNHIAAPRSGRITAILVADGMPVEYGQPLLVIE
jgi:acetyl-CoA carboxylase biotin carboxyl carrier protein